MPQVGASQPTPQEQLLPANDMSTEQMGGQDTYQIQPLVDQNIRYMYNYVYKEIMNT